jgi:hypothetical protein
VSLHVPDKATKDTEYVPGVVNIFVGLNAVELPLPKFQLKLVAPELWFVKLTVNGAKPLVTLEVNEAVGTPFITRTVAVLVQPVVGLLTVKE